MRTRDDTHLPGSEELLRAAVAALAFDRQAFERHLDALVRRLPASLGAAEELVDAGIGHLWGRGWTPADLAHVVGRRLADDHAGAVAGRVVLDGRRHAAQGRALHPRWQAQLADLEGPARRTASLPAPARLRLLVEALALLERLPALPRTLPAPGRLGAATARGAVGVDDRLLARVRALLAKAESTTFDEEAEAFTAKAQELISRHAIDEVLLHAGDGVGAPSARRLLVDDPYASAKAGLVGQVALANRCRAVHSTDLGWVTLFGYDQDLDAVELVATSLLTQATAAMVRQGPRRDHTGRSRTRSFRHAFLLGFAARIGERLRRVTEDAVAARAGDRDRLLPVLAARDDRVRAAEAEAFPRIVRRRPSVTSVDGWWAGEAAAELADLGSPPRRLPGR